MNTIATVTVNPIARIWRRWFLRMRIKAAEHDIEQMRTTLEFLPPVIAGHERQCEIWRVELAILERAK